MRVSVSKSNCVVVVAAMVRMQRKKVKVKVKVESGGIVIELSEETVKERVEVFVFFFCFFLVQFGVVVKVRDREVVPMFVGFAVFNVVAVLCGLRI